MTLTPDRDRLEDLSAGRSPTSGPPIEMAVVTEVERGDGTPGTAYATIEYPDGFKTEVYPASGLLPAVGDQVAMVPNGSDPVHFATRVMVDGDMQSRTWAGVDGPPGWLLTADGDLYAVNAYLRGEVVAEIFRTALDPTIEGAIIISSDAGANTIILRRPGTLEDFPAAIEAGISHLEIRGTDDRARMRLTADGVASLYGETATNISTLSGPVVISTPAGVFAGFPGAEVNLDDPPRASGDRSSATVSVTAATPTTIVCNSTYDIAPLLGGADSVDFDTGTGAFTPLVPGRYEGRITGNWAAHATPYNGQVGFQVDGVDVFGPGQTQGQDVGTGQQFVAEFDLDGSTDDVVPVVRHTSGTGAKNFLLTEFRLWRKHA